MRTELKYFLMIVGVLAVVYLVNRYSSGTQENLENTNTIVLDNKPVVPPTNNQAADNNSASDVLQIPQDQSNDNYSSDTSLPTVSTSEKEDKVVKSKFDSKNKARAGKYKRLNYKDGKRGQANDDISKFFDDNNSLVKDGQLANDDFVGQSEGDLLATYKPGPRKALTDDDIFKSENYLPKETNQDWFEVMPEPISVKNRHLINVSRPVGVNTIGNSLRNPSYDLRGTPPCPKFVVSPWSQSTIEPDYNIKGLC